MVETAVPSGRCEWTRSLPESGAAVLRKRRPVSTRNACDRRRSAARWHAGPVRRSRPTALALLATAVLTALAACSAPTPAVVAPSSVDASATAAPPSVGAVPPGLERFYAQTLSWGPCSAFAGPDDEAAFAEKRYECARLEVPLDYAAPTARTAQLGVLRLEASGAKIGSLVVNPGGPGASGMSAVPSLFGSGPGAEGPLTARFDVVGLDPRGVGASTPTIDCLTDAEWEVERGDLDVDPSPAGVAQTEDENRRYAQRCTDRVGADVLAHVGTRDAARDLDVLRAALGDPQLTYLGFSYGTRLGSTYAEDFPQNVRALVLDGALDPSQSTVDRSVAQAAGFQQAFDAFAAECARQGDCPLGTDPARSDGGVPGDHPPAGRPPAGRRRPHPELPGRDHRSHAGALRVVGLARARPGHLGAGQGRRHDPAAAGRPLPRPPCGRQLRQRDRGVRRDQLRRRAAHHRSRPRSPTARGASWPPRPTATPDSGS